MYTLSDGGFFGEYNIMFGLYSDLSYQAEIDPEQGKYVIIFNINKKVLMESISQDFGSFIHFHDLSLQKFRYD